MTTLIDEAKAARRMNAKRRKLYGKKLGAIAAKNKSRRYVPGMVFQSSMPKGIQIVSHNEAGERIVFFIAPKGQGVVKTSKVKSNTVRATSKKPRSKTK